MTWSHTPLLIIHFVKCHMGLSLGDKEATQLCALLSVHKLSNVCAVTSQWQTLKQVLWLAIDNDAQFYLYSDFWTDILVAKFVLHVVTHSYYTIVTEIWAMLLGSGIIYLNHGNWNSCISEPCKTRVACIQYEK